MLRVVPERRDCVPVVIAQGAVRSQVGVVAAVRQKTVHQAGVKGILLIAITMVLIARVGVAAIDAKWIDPVGIIGKQSGADKVIHARCVAFRAAEIATAVLVR